LLGVLMLIDDARHDPLRDLDHLLHTLTALSLQCKIAIGIMTADPETLPDIEKYHRHLSGSTSPWCLSPPIFHVDCSSSRDMAMLMQALLCSVDPGVQGGAIAGSDAATISETMTPSPSTTHRS
jgi:hypothetical protein